jgi:hypothetical protein
MDGTTDGRLRQQAEALLPLPFTETVVRRHHPVRLSPKQQALQWELRPWRDEDEP